MNEVSDTLSLERDFSVVARGSRQVLQGVLRIDQALVFAPQLRVRIHNAGVMFGANSADTQFLSWLPRGRYRFEIQLPGALPPGAFQVVFEVWHKQAMQWIQADGCEGEFTAGVQTAGVDEPLQWAFEAIPPTPSIHSLGWKKGHGDWFYRHFDHAAETIISYLLGDSPLLRGRILDVGCGDGITDLGVALRTGCSELVGLEPFRQYERLPGILRDNHLPADSIPANLRFVAEDANFLPFADDSFDVVLSWGSMEHIAGGYLQALREIKRVLRPDGLFMAAPGLFYSNIGHHLDEFSSEPFFHLKMSREEIKRMVLETPPKYIDRSGEFATNEQYWQWFCELNPITVARFEQELRALDFRPWRIALRTDALVEYTPAIEHYPIQDLANIELYSSWISRKKVRT